MAVRTLRGAAAGMPRPVCGTVADAELCSGRSAVHNSGQQRYDVPHYVVNLISETSEHNPLAPGGNALFNVHLPDPEGPTSQCRRLLLAGFGHFFVISRSDARFLNL